MNYLSETKNELSAFIRKYITENYKVAHTENEGYRFYKKNEPEVALQIIISHVQHSRIAIIKALDSLPNYQMYSNAKSMMGKDLSHFIDCEIEKVWNSMPIHKL